MDNYAAIMKMNREQMEEFLDNVYCAGLNNGMYAARQASGEDEILDFNPFDMEWLGRDAEPATLCIECEDGDRYVLDALVQAVLRNAGIDPLQDEEVE